MGAHLIGGQFQSDKYPTTPRGKVPLSVEDPTAQDLLWEYAQRRRAVDAEFADDLETALQAAGYACKRIITSYIEVNAANCECCAPRAGAREDHAGFCPARCEARAVELRR